MRDAPHPYRARSIPLTAIGARRLTEKVVEILTEQIVSGQLRPGQLLPTQREMAKEMDVSLTIIREALKILHAQGLLQIKHGVGSFISPVSQWKVGESLFLAARAHKANHLNWLETRTILEIGIAGLAAERATRENLEAMATALQRMHESLTQDSHPDFVEADFAFHIEVAQAT